MIAANGVTAQFLERKGFPSLRRVLRSPERWDRIVELAAGLGERLPAEPSAPALEGSSRGGARPIPARFPDLSLSVVKLLGSRRVRGGAARRARWTGTSASPCRDYTHSTAPNRRFPDLVTQRCSRRRSPGSPSPYAASELDELARHCTQQEDDATKVERQVRKSAAALLLAAADRRAVRRRSSPAPPRRAPGCASLQPAGRGQASCAAMQGLDVGDRGARASWCTPTSSAGFIDFAARGSFLRLMALAFVGTL